jgi:chromosomal replication initiator protein
VYKKKLRKHLEGIFSSSELEQWFDPLDIRPEPEKGLLHIAFPHMFFRRRFMDHVGRIFEQALLSFEGTLRAHYGENTPDSAFAPRFEPDGAEPDRDIDNTDARLRRPGTNAARSGKNAAAESAPAEEYFLPEHYTFDNFLFNSKNELPVTTARETSELVSAGNHPRYNPFVVYGPSGSGKSHLLGAMARALQQNGCNVFYGNIMTFPALLETAPGSCPASRNACIFLDDAQRIASSSNIRDALVALMDIHLSSHKLLAFSFDRHPAGCRELGRPLLSRITSGLVVELKRPDLDIRLSYAEKRSSALKLDLNKEQLLDLANKNADIRSLDGYFSRLAAYTAVSSKNGSPAPAREAYATLTLKETSNARLTPELIIAVVAEHFSVDAGELIGKRRDGKLSQARYIAVFLCRELLRLKLVTLGNIFGKRNHTSVLYAVRSIAKRCLIDNDTNKLVEELKHTCLSRC